MNQETNFSQKGVEPDLVGQYLTNWSRMGGERTEIFAYTLINVSEFVKFVASKS